MSNEASRQKNKSSCIVYFLTATSHAEMADPASAPRRGRLTIAQGKARRSAAPGGPPPWVAVPSPPGFLFSNLVFGNPPGPKTKLEKRKRSLLGLPTRMHRGHILSFGQLGLTWAAGAVCILGMARALRIQRPGGGIT